MFLRRLQQVIYFNGHIHHQTANSCFVVNLTEKFDPNLSYFILGIHPWHIEDHDLNLLTSLIKKYKDHQNFAGIGEIGIDRSIKSPLLKQIEYFTSQVKLAKEIGIQCLTIHSVRAHSDIMNILKKENYTGSLLIHDYRSNIETYDQYQKNWNTYLSFGKSLINSTKSEKLFPKINKNKIILETDDDKDLCISKVYNKATQLLSMNNNRLNMITTQNFQDFLHR